MAKWNDTQIIYYILFSYFYILFSFLESAHQTAKKSLGLIDISHDCNHCFSKHSTAKWIACNMSRRLFVLLQNGLTAECLYCNMD